MLAEVRRCADNRDIKGLHYIFVDSLDVDPTFETYREDYEYCKKIEGMFAPHREMSPMLNDKTQWTPQYWEQLKLDLMKNFSEKRFEHMISVARIVYSEKVSKLDAERRKKSESIPGDARANAVDKKSQIPAKEKMVSSDASPRVISEQEQKAQMERKKRALEEENRRVEAKQQEQRRRIEDQRTGRVGQTAQNSGGESKKALGVVLAIIIIVVLVVIIIATLK